MNTEFFEALKLLEKEKGISADYLLEKIKNAIAIAVKEDYFSAENVFVSIDDEKQEFIVSIGKEVVEEVFDPTCEIGLDEARKLSGGAQVGDYVDVQLETKDFGRIAAQTAKHVIKQGIREAERGQMFEKFRRHVQEIVTGRIVRIDPRKGIITVEIDGNETVLLKSEQVPGETYTDGAFLKVYIVDVTETEKGPRVMISRTHPGLVKRLFENEVPEIYDGTVEIRSISREAGSRTKLAVYSQDPNVDAVGACIGPKGTRVAKVVDELGGEKIDVVRYSEQPEEFIRAALSPAEVVAVRITDIENRMCRAVVPDGQLSLAIGNKGQNARLAARLTGWKIDIRPASDPMALEVEEPKAPEESEEDALEVLDEVLTGVEEDTESEAPVAETGEIPETEETAEVEEIVTEAEEAPELGADFEETAEEEAAEE